MPPCPKSAAFLAASLLCASSRIAQSLAYRSTQAKQVETRPSLPRGCGGAADLTAVMSKDPKGEGAQTQLDFSVLDNSVSPCNDFFNFATGNWVKRNPIPADYASWGIAEELDHRNQEILRSILEKAAADKSA